jgi:hypothetical protein
MQCLEEEKMHPRSLSANQELRCFLQCLESVADGTRTVTDQDLDNISLRLMTLAPQIGDASRSETLDTTLQNEVAEYVKNIGALQGVMKKVRCAMTATRAHQETKNQNMGALPDLFGCHQQPK